jgi:hypothetical protein
VSVAVLQQAGRQWAKASLGVAQQNVRSFSWWRRPNKEPSKEID